MSAEAATPITEERKPMVIVLGLMPGALAVFPAGVAVPPAEPPELFDELLHAPATTTVTATTDTALPNRKRTVPPCEC
jgi:hypothetical protein